MDSYLDKVPSALQASTFPTALNSLILSDPTPNQPNNFNIITTWKQNVYETADNLQYESVHEFKAGEVSTLKKVKKFPMPCSKTVLESYSPSQSLKASITKRVNPNSKKDDYVLEIWSSSALNKCVNLSSLEKHGIVHADTMFSCFQWSSDETKLLYIAEKKTPKTTGFFGLSNSDSKDKKDVLVGEKFNYEESWGELLTDVTNPVICIFHVSNNDLEVISCLSVDISPAHPQWGPNNSIIFEGIDNKPFRLGLVYCMNRYSGLYQLHLGNENHVEEIAADRTVVRISPHISHCKSKMVFLQRDLEDGGNSHGSPVSLMLYDFQSGNSTKFTSFEWKGNLISLCARSFPKNCWFDDNVHVAISFVTYAESFAAVINTDSGKIIRAISCNDVLAVHSNFLISWRMKLASTFPSLQISQFSATSFNTVSETEVLDDTIENGSIKDEYSMVSHYLIPKPRKNLIPLVVIPHGGPHSVFTDDYNRNAAFFCKLGYAVLLVNYRGSTSFTKASLHSLAGCVGDQDAKDVQNFVIKFIELHHDFIDLKNIFVFGGSHGGFLAAHLIGQYPEFYRAASMRNPVIDIASMSLVTDIPDWCYFESGLSYTQSKLPEGEAYKTMVEKSPVIHIKAVKAPVLLCIGEKDMRVPPSQGKAYFRLLKANGKVAKLLLYPDDSHPLWGVETDGDCIINVCKWFYQHRCINDN